MQLVRSVHVPLWLSLAGLSLSSDTDRNSLPIPSYQRNHLQHQQDPMDSKFDVFVGSIGLSGPDAQALKSSYGNKPADKLSAACLATQFVLGKDAVDTAPLNQTVVEANWSKANVAKPHCIVTPTSAHAVSVTIKALSFFQVKFAVRSGGHSPNPGFSSVGDGGVLLDLSKLNQLTLSEDKSVVSVGPGQRWGEVYSFLDTYGLSVIGGRIPNVGVGGLILGGGLHHFSAKYGLAADNVHNFEVVLSDGTITNANAKENTDLFWALKGGGPNFGVVTRFDLYTVPTRNIWLRLTVHALDQANDIFDAFAEWQTRGGATDSRATVITGIALDSIAIGLVFWRQHVDGLGTTAPGTFAPLDGLPFLQALADGVPTTLLALMEQMGAATTNAATRHDYRAASSRVDARLYKDVYTFWRARALAAREATGANQTFVLQPVPRSLARAGAAKGGILWVYPMRTINVRWTTLVDWTDAADDGEVRAVSIDTTRQWAKLGQERGLHLPFLYQDDSSRDQHPLATYGEENVAKLKQIALKYDKTQFFQKMQNGGFSCPRSNQVSSYGQWM
ncbi:uncharacterized protein PG986_003917 [Apiospora aurea]|uniref:FAD-binding PCMH-type domain-containing protein n=1 Tax=Apiospora aurea TaxID=335848 RepID=A0ABR1QLD2_9PEZI